MKRYLLAIGLFTSCLLINNLSFACTDVRLTAKDGSVIVGRSLEFGTNLNSTLMTSTRGRVYKTTAPDGNPAMSWTAKYGYVFVDGLNSGVTIDGMNEQGLSFEYLYLPGYTQYQSIMPSQDSQALPYYLLGDWVLSNFKSVDEVQQALNNVRVFQQQLASFGNTIFYLHASIQDASGKGIVVEFVNGQMKVYKNIGIMTNSPTYDWQVANIRNFLNLSPYNPNPVQAGSAIYDVNGQGSGMVGIPGDASPAARFIKMATYSKYVLPVNNAAMAVNLMQHLLNSVDIPFGIVRAKQANGPDIYDSTQWIVIKDLTHKIFYYRTYNNLSLHAVALTALDFSSSAKILKMPLADPTVVINMNDKFTHSVAGAS